MMQKDPNKMMSDSLSMNMTGYHPRTFLLTPESMKLIKYEDVNHIYETAFDDASAFTFFITGNIEEEVAREMASLYIGSLPSKHMTETYRDLGMNQPEGTVRKEIPVPLTVPKARLLSVIPQEQNTTLQQPPDGCIEGYPRPCIYREGT
jgi:zinc protease